MAAKILMVGSVMMDLILQMEKMPVASESVLGKTYSNAGGGKGSNSAIAAARLGGDVAVYGTVGKDSNGEALRQMIQNENVDTTYLKTDDSEKTGMAVILLEDGGNNRIIIYKGANETTSADAVEEAVKTIKPEAVMLQLEIPLITNKTALKAAQEQGIITCLDAGPAQDYPLEEMQGLTILSPNETETKALTGIFPDDDETCLQASKRLMERSNCQYVVLKLGKQGSYIYGEGKAVLVPAYKVDAVDPTAAGDAFTGALVKHFVESGDMVKAAEYANAVGAITCTALGAQSSLPNQEAVEAFLQTVK